MNRINYTSKIHLQRPLSPRCEAHTPELPALERLLQVSAWICQPKTSTVHHRGKKLTDFVQLLQRLEKS